MSVLINSRYNPARGGHAPGDLRTAFEEAVEAICDWNEGDPEPTVEVREREMAVGAVCGLLWNCEDILPSGTMECVDPDFGCGSYAAAARVLKSVIATTKGASRLK